MRFPGWCRRGKATAVHSCVGDPSTYHPRHELIQTGLKPGTALEKEEILLEDGFLVAGRTAELCLDGKHVHNPREAQPAAVFVLTLLGGPPAGYWLERDPCSESNVGIVPFSVILPYDTISSVFSTLPAPEPGALSS